MSKLSESNPKHHFFQTMDSSISKDAWFEKKSRKEVDFTCHGHGATDNVPLSWNCANTQMTN